MTQTENSLSNRTIATSRLIDAPREQLFDAFANPDQLMHWWGPRGFTNTFEEFDFRPDGNWRFVMHAPNGASFPNHSVFVEIVKPERIVFKHMSNPRFQMTLTFATEGGKTRLGWNMLFESAEDCAKVKGFAVDANEQNIDRLISQLTKISTGQRSFVLSRLFDAPRDLVWKAWTDTEHMKWLGPKGLSVTHAKFDLRAGGRCHYAMTTPEGHEMWGRWVIREVVKPESLVFVNSFSDKEGGITRHPGSATWPLEMLSIITFAERDGKTLLTIEWLPLNATEAERKTFDEGHASMTQGWSGSLDRLDEHLAEIQKPVSR